MRNKFVILLSLVILLGIISCNKDFNKITSSDWSPDVAAPFIHTTILLNNLISSDSNLITQEDSSLIYIYHEDSVFKISADSLLQISEEITENEQFSLGELSMGDFGFESEFTMNDVLPFLDQAVQDTLLKYDGSTHYFPPFALLEAASVESEIIEEFIELSFSEGKMHINLVNNLPVSLTDIEFSLIDDVNDQIIKDISIPLLLSGQSFVDSADISAMTLGNEFSFIIYSLNSSGSFPEMVPIELSQSIGFNIQTSGLKVIAGKAKIIEQLMYSEIKNIDFPLEPEQLYHILISEGLFSYNLASDLNVDVQVRLELPTASIDNQIPVQEFELSSKSIVSQSWDISGMSADLTTNEEQAYNRMPISLEILILPTEEIVVFDSADKVYGDFNMEEIILSFADGYLGKQTVNVSKDTLDLNFDFLSGLEGELILEEPSLTIEYVNSIGVPLRISTEFFGVNTSTGASQYLNYDSVDISIPEEAGQEVNDEILIDKTNSSIVDFLAIRPDRIIYYGGGLTNTEGYNLNFIDETSQLIGHAELMIPLILRADHLSFTDTLKVSSSSDDFPVKEGFLKLNVINGFPMDLKMSLVLSDSISGIILDEIEFDEIASALVDVEGKVSSKTATEIIVEMDEAFLENLRISNRGFLDVETSTFGQGSVPVILYSDYEIDVAIGFLAKIAP